MGHALMHRALTHRIKRGATHAPCVGMRVAPKPRINVARGEKSGRAASQKDGRAGMKETGEIACKSGGVNAEQIEADGQVVGSSHFLEAQDGRCRGGGIVRLLLQLHFALVGLVRALKVALERVA